MTHTTYATAPLPALVDRVPVKVAAEMLGHADTSLPRCGSTTTCLRARRNRRQSKARPVGNGGQNGGQRARLLGPQIRKLVETRESRTPGPAKFSSGLSYRLSHRFGSRRRGTVVVPIPAGQPKSLSRTLSASIRGTLALQRPRQPHQDEGFKGRRHLVKRRERVGCCQLFLDA